MSLNDFLAGQPVTPEGRPSKKCSICTNEELAAEVAQYIEGRRDGSIVHSVNWIWMNYFAPSRGICSVSTFRNHIRIHLGITDI